MRQHEIALLKEHIGAQRDSLLGVTSSLRQVQDIIRAMEDFNRGATQDQDRRLARITELEQEISSLEDAIAAAGATTTGAAEDITEGTSAIGEEFQDVVEGGDALHEVGDALGRTLIDQENTLGRLRNELDALLEGIDDIADTFSAEEIADMWTVAAADAGSALINLIREIRGEEWGAAEERQFQTKMYALTIAAQMAAVQSLLELSTTLDETTRGMLQGLIDEGQAILGELAGGLELPSRRGGRGRGQRRQIREQFREDAEAVTQAFLGMSDAALQLRASISSLHEFASEARRAGTP